MTLDISAIRQRIENFNRDEFSHNDLHVYAYADLRALCDEVERLRKALQLIVEGDTECGCKHDTDECCAKAGYYCATCIAGLALLDGDLTPPASTPAESS